LQQKSDLNHVGHPAKNAVLDKIRFDAARAAISGDYQAILPQLWWVILYVVVVMGIAIIVFTQKMKSDNQ